MERESERENKKKSGGGKRERGGSTEVRATRHYSGASFSTSAGENLQSRAELRACSHASTHILLQA
eukprot:4903141-Pleurochrysis_carterae.AAC.1